MKDSFIRIKLIISPAIRRAASRLLLLTALALTIHTCAPPDLVTDLEQDRDKEKIYTPPPPPGSNHSQIAIDLMWDQFKKRHQEFQAKGYRLTDVETYNIENFRCYAGVWHEESDSQLVEKADGWDEFKAMWFQMKDQGYRLTDVEVYFENDRRKILGVWSSKETYEVRFQVNLTWQQLVEAWKKLAKEGFLLIDLEPYASRGTVRYVGIWKAGKDIKHRLWKASSWGEFRSKWREFGRAGYRLFDIEIFREAGIKKYTGIWSPGEDNYRMWVEAPWENFQVRKIQFELEGLYMVDLEVEDDPHRRFSGVWRHGHSRLREDPPSYKELRTGGE